MYTQKTFHLFTSFFFACVTIYRGFYVPYAGFVSALEKYHVDTSGIKLENMKPEEKSKMNKQKVTPFVLERAIRYCGQWDDFVSRCGCTDEKNPIMAVINTNSRASPDIVTSDSMPANPPCRKPFSGQASFGAFYIMSTLGYVLTTMEENIDPGSKLAATIPGERPFQEWSLGKSCRIRHHDTKLCIGFPAGCRAEEDATPCIVEDSNDRKNKSKKWCICEDGTIRCAEKPGLVLEISAKDVGKKFLSVSLRPYRPGANEQMFMVVNYAPAFTPDIKPYHFPTLGDSVPYSPTPYTERQFSFLSKGCSGPQGQQPKQEPDTCGCYIAHSTIFVPLKPSQNPASPQPPENLYNVRRFPTTPSNPTTRMNPGMPPSHSPLLPHQPVNHIQTGVAKRQLPSHPGVQQQQQQQPVYMQPSYNFQPYSPAQNPYPSPSYPGVQQQHQQQPKGYYY